MQLLELNSPGVVHLRERDWRLAHLIDFIGPIQYTRPQSAFHCLSHSIIEQMLSMKAAATIERRVNSLCGEELSPSALLAVSEDELRRCGLSSRKAHHLHVLAEYASAEDIESLAQLSDEQIRTTLMRLPGIGKWTCDMFLLFYLERQDILPAEDGAFRQAFQWLYGVSLDYPEACNIICSLWRPYSSIAARYLYRALNDGTVKAVDATQLCSIWPNE